MRNAGGHSSLPRKDNAIYELADALKAVQAYRFPVMWNETTLAWFRVTGARTAGPTGDAMRRFAVNPKDAAAYDVLWNSPADVGATRTTCIPTLLRGGHADNALPQSATATINCRIFPGVKVDDVRAQLQALAGSGVAVAVLGTPEPSDESPLRPDVLAAVGKAVHARHPGVPVAPYQESGGTDGRLFRAAGIPTYGVGETFIKSIYDAVTSGPGWERTVLVVNFDEWGGFYDHVVPEEAPDANNPLGDLASLFAEEDTSVAARRSVVSRLPIHPKSRAATTDSR